MRTFSRYDWMAAQTSWEEAEFSHEWRPFRDLAASVGMIYPPTGSRWDSWSDDEPSQRALLVRAIRETPDELRKAIRSSRSWGEVVGKLNRQRDEWRELDDLEVAYVRRERAIEEPSHIESAQSVASILRRMQDSAA